MFKAEYTSLLSAGADQARNVAGIIDKVLEFAHKHF